MSGPRVIAVCPVYDPPPTTAEGLRRLGGQTAGVVVVDDGSPRPVELEGIVVDRLPENRGIATALNRGVRAAAAAGATHVLTVDQDSSFPDDYVQQLLACARRAELQGLRPGAVGAVEFSGLRHEGHFRDGVLVVEESIQSGTLFSVQALAQIGGFDESLVIDAVDTDACLRLQDAGWDVCVAPVGFAHALGEGHFVSLLGRRVWSSRHSALRRYYITRNGVVVLRRHGRTHPRWAMVYARRLLVSTWLSLREGDPDLRRAVREGVADGWRRRLGRRPTRAEGSVVSP